MQVSHDCTWQLTIGLHLLEASTCSLLKDFSHKLSSVSEVLCLLSILDSCKFCIGNGDEIFERVASERKGVLKDRSGKICL